jgi:hypothetical protein
VTEYSDDEQRAEQEPRLCEHAAPGDDRVLERIGLTSEPALTAEAGEVDGSDAVADGMDQDAMPDLVHDDDAHEREPQDRLEAQAAEDERAHRNAPVQPQVYSRQATHAKIAIDQHIARSEP